MVDYFIEIKSAAILNSTMSLVCEGYIFDCPYYAKPKLMIHFDNGTEERYIPMVLQEISHEGTTCRFAGLYNYKLDKIYWDTQNKDVISNVTFDLFVNNELTCDASVYLDPERVMCQSNRFSTRGTTYGHLVIHQAKPVQRKSRKAKIKKVVSSLLGSNSRETDDFYADGKGKQANVSWNNSRLKKARAGFKRAFIMLIYEIYARRDVRNDQVLILSQRSDELMDNELFIYDELARDAKLKIICDVSTVTYGRASLFRLFRFSRRCALSKVIIVDEYVPPLYFLHRRSETSIIQVWHACGAFKTVGFSRLGKQDAPIQSRRAHRNYDYSIVSSSEICRWYAEAFGLSPEKVLPLGVPRTDIFFSEKYKSDVMCKITESYPQIKGKKVILFAPTFRGGIKAHANYPFDMFDVAKIIEEIGDEYVLLLKHHPFLQEKHPVPESVRGRVIDVSDFPSVNDLLFATDLLISDYSSVIFEASLLDIPMLFYAYDIDEYVASRDFYYEFRDFVPGKIVYGQDELIAAIKAEDYEHEKVSVFRDRFFDYKDGLSTRRICDLIYSCCEDNQGGSR